jgi:formimidoylglutamate deiminase
VARSREELESLRSHVAAEHPGDLSWLGIQIFNAAGLPLDQLKDIAAYGHAQRFRLQYHPDESQADEAWISWLGRNALLDKRVTVMLGGELGAEEERQLASTRAMACVCPLSRRRSMLAAAGLERLRAAGLEVAVGLADHVRSNALEVLRSLPSGLPPVERLRLATAGGARSLGAPSGALEVGRPADFLTVNLYEPSLAGSSSEGLLAAVLEAAERRAIREVWIGARPRVNNGRHVQQGPIVGRFVELQQRLHAAAAGPGRD